MIHCTTKPNLSKRAKKKAKKRAAQEKRGAALIDAMLEAKGAKPIAAAALAKAKGQESEADIKQSKMPASEIAKDSDAKDAGLSGFVEDEK